MAKVSIVIPVYNVERYLRECLDSVKNQTLQDIEIICVDDGSKDSSGAILDEYANNDERFRIIHKQNEGYGKAMNIGMATATSPYIGIVESDDYIASNMFETLYTIIEKYKVDVVKSDHYEFCENYKGKYIEDYIPIINDEKYFDLYGKVLNVKEHECVLGFRKYTWSGLYRTSFLRQKKIAHNETSGAAFQDNGFWFQSMIMHSSIYFVKQAFYRYRIDNINSSIHSKGNPFAVCNEYDFIDSILQRMEAEGLPFYKWSTYIRIKDSANCITRVSNDNKEKLAKRVREEFLKASNLGRVDYNLYPSWCSEKNFKIVANPCAYAEDEKRKAEKLQKLVSNPVIIIYGAGEIGTKIYNSLREKGFSKKIYFAVSDDSFQGREIRGIPVNNINVLKKYVKEAFVIISVGKKNVEVVEQNVKKLQFEHWIHYSELELF